MPSGRLIAACLCGMLVLMAGCGEDSEPSGPIIEISDDQLSLQIRTWVNQLGLAQTDLAVWRQRLERACTEGVWDDEVATRLAGEFIEEDLTTSVRDESLGSPSATKGAEALWLIAVNVCRDVFPEGEVEEGPPSG